MKYTVRISFIGYYKTEVEAKNPSSAKKIAVEKYEETELPKGFEIGDTNNEISVTSKLNIIKANEK